MNITIRISADELPSTHQKIINNALGLESKQDYTDALEKIAKAAFLEYCEMIIERGTPSKIDEIREARLFLLIKHFFQNRLPNETEVENLFHLGSKSRALLQNTLHHYINRLTIVQSSLLGYIKKAKLNEDTNNFELECNSPTIIQEMNNIVKQNWLTLEKITIKKGTSGIYVFAPDTFDKLKFYLNG